MRRLFCFLLLIMIGCTQLRAIDATDLRGPISLKLECEGDFAEGYPWLLEVKADGTASLLIKNYSSPVSREFEVTQDQFEELRKLLIDEKFFELKGEYGERVPSGSTSTLSVTCGDHKHSVKLHYLMNWVQGDTARLREPARALRICRLVRTWFSYADAVDLQDYDDRVINAAGS